MIFKAKSTLLLVIVAIGMLLTTATKAQTKVGGMTASQAFPDDRVARLVTAIDLGDFTEADRLHRAGADVNTVGVKDVSPLLWVMLATQDARKMDYLLRIGANPNYRATDGSSAMYMAAGWKNKDLLENLLAHGGNPNLMGTDNRPVLFEAVNQFRTDNIKLLVQAGADVNWTDHTEMTIANQAAALGRFDYVAFFIDHGLTRNLQFLARAVWIRRVPPGSEKQQQKDHVIEMLEQRGVTFPVAPFTPQTTY